MRSSRNILIIALIVIGLLLIEVGREEILFTRERNRTEHSYWLVRTGMTEAQVRAAIGEPDEISRENQNSIWTWSTRKHQGFLITNASLSSIRRQYSLVVTFGVEGKVLDVFGGIE
jgi:hypothetical protein